ncbi:MAG: sulfite exporter TauE/SafE family protein [Planctomycetes bacterium]|nr:sulfite exporter TauE/SafE family protein [Planctomycetota bacterium]
MLTAALFLTMLIAWRDRRHVDFIGLRYAFAGRIAGTIPAAILVSMITATVFDVLFGVLVVLAVAFSLIGPRLSPTPRASICTGALSGFMATTAAIGGPPMALLYPHEDGRRLRGTLAGYFLLGATLSLIALAIVGRYGRPEIALGLTLCPGILLGFAVSGALTKHLDRRGARPIVLALSAAAGFVVLWRALG